MDSYEAFIDEYVAFMKKYSDNPSDVSLLADYTKYMSKYADMVEKFDKWESEDLNDAGLAYYIDVQARVSKKLYNAPPVKTTHEKIIVNQIIPHQLILSPEPPCYRSAQRNCPAEQGCLDRLGLAGTMALARCPQLLNPLRTLAAAAQPARTRLSRSVACDAKQLW